MACGAAVGQELARNLFSGLFSIARAEFDSANDFITDLPLCGGFNGLYTCVDKLTKFVKVIPISILEGALPSPKVACLFFKHVVQLFGILYIVLHDAHFTAHFWRCLRELLGSRAALSLAYHPQSDGQTQCTH